MAEIDLNTKFPQLRPISSPPGLFRFNGFGVGIYGSRDPDAETGTYVATYCISALWVPILALRAYRVARAGEGWYFLGREPPGEQVLSMALTGGLQPPQLLIDFNQPHRGDRPLADLLEPVLFLGLQFNLAGHLEQFRLGVLDVLAEQPQREQPLARPDDVAGKGVDGGDDADHG